MIILPTIISVKQHPLSKPTQVRTSFFRHASRWTDYGQGKTDVRAWTEKDDQGKQTEIDRGTSNTTAAVAAAATRRRERTPTVICIVLDLLLLQSDKGVDFPFSRSDRLHRRRVPFSRHYYGAGWKKEDEENARRRWWLARLDVINILHPRGIPRALVFSRCFTVSSYCEIK